jgi:hypothetical protein
MSLRFDSIILVSSQKVPASIHDRTAILDYYIDSRILRAQEEGWSFAGKFMEHNASPLANLQAGYLAITGDGRVAV